MTIDSHAWLADLWVMSQLSQDQPSDAIVHLFLFVHLSVCVHVFVCLVCALFFGFGLLWPHACTGAVIGHIVGTRAEAPVAEQNHN